MKRYTDLTNRVHIRLRSVSCGADGPTARNPIRRPIDDTLGDVLVCQLAFGNASPPELCSKCFLLLKMLNASLVVEWYMMMSTG
jgi:hypothetical protein